MIGLKNPDRSTPNIYASTNSASLWETLFCLCFFVSVCCFITLSVILPVFRCIYLLFYLSVFLCICLLLYNSFCSVLHSFFIALSVFLCLSLVLSVSDYFNSIICKALWITIVCEMCYINKLYLFIFSIWCSVCHSACLFLCIRLLLALFISAVLCVCLSFYLSVCHSVYLLFYLYVILLFCLSFFLSVILFIVLFVWCSLCSITPVILSVLFFLSFCLSFYVCPSSYDIYTCVKYNIQMFCELCVCYMENRWPTHC